VRDLGLVRLGDRTQPGLQLVQVLREGVPFGEDLLQMGLELGNARGDSGIGRRRLGQLCIQLLGEPVPLGEDRLQLRLELGNPRGSGRIGRRLLSLVFSSSTVWAEVSRSATTVRSVDSSCSMRVARSGGSAAAGGVKRSRPGGCAGPR
jgi:hypothetical protein